MGRPKFRTSVVNCPLSVNPKSHLQKQGSKLIVNSGTFKFKCNAGSVESGYARLQHRHSDDD